MKKKSAPVKKTARSPNSHGRIVVIGASAGGLEAVTSFLKYLPADTGMTFFYVQHLSPLHTSNLATLLASSTKMKVEEVKNGMRILQNHLYVSTPNQDMSLVRNRIKLQPRKSKGSPYLPINVFFAATAVHYKKRV